ncbi:MAG: amidohydrolase family protein, partial [Bacteroidota bacterium]
NLYHTSLMTTMEGKHPAKTYGSDRYIDGVNINYVKGEGSIKPIIEQAVKDQAVALKLMIEDGPQPPFVKRIPEKYVAMLSEEAHTTGLDFFAHVSDMYEVRTAVKYKADALMHFMGVQIDWKNDLEILQKAVQQNVSWVSTAMIGKSFFYMLNKEWLENEHYQVFTADQIGYFKDEDGALEAESRVVLTGLFGSDKIPAMAVMKSMMQDLKKLHDMGINVVVGTDLGGRPFIVPGFSFHEEMQLFELGGFSGEQIIQCATLNAAKMLKVDDDYGSIEKGKVADFIILDKNPLEQIVNTLSIHDVYKNGILQPRIQKN